jgi:hypothetical protein
VGKWGEVKAQRRARAEESPKERAHLIGGEEAEQAPRGRAQRCAWAAKSELLDFQRNDAACGQESRLAEAGIRKGIADSSSCAMETARAKPRRRLRLLVT